MKKIVFLLIFFLNIFSSVVLPRGWIIEFMPGNGAKKHTDIYDKITVGEVWYYIYEAGKTKIAGLVNGKLDKSKVYHLPIGKPIVNIYFPIQLPDGTSLDFNVGDIGYTANDDFNFRGLNVIIDCFEFEERDSSGKPKLKWYVYKEILDFGSKIL